MEDIEIDLNIVKEQILKASIHGSLIERKIISEDLTYLSMFINGIMGFMLGKNMNLRIKGNQSEIRALKDVLINNRVLMNKLKNGSATKEEIEGLLKNAKISKDRFIDLTGIPLPF